MNYCHLLQLLGILEYVPCKLNPIRPTGKRYGNLLSLMNKFQMLELPVFHIKPWCLEKQNVNKQPNWNIPNDKKPYNFFRMKNVD